MKKVILYLLLLLPAMSYSLTLQPYEKGQLAGSLGFGAMTLDAYYEICFSKGMRTDNHLNGIDKLLKEKWGFSYTEIAIEEGKKEGRDYREEAHQLVNTARRKTGGCSTTGMEKWYREFQNLHEMNLIKFHDAN